MNAEIIKEGILYEFSEPFRSQLIAAIRRSESKMPRADPPTEKQIWFLKKHGQAIPKTKREASEIIGRLKGR